MGFAVTAAELVDPNQGRNINIVRGITIQWTGLLDWTTGLDYWTDIFLVFAHSLVGFYEVLLVSTLRAPAVHF